MNSEKCFSRTITVEVIVGLFVALVFIALGIFTIVISGSKFLNNNQYPMKVAFGNAMGLRRNDPVIARGTPVGIVNRVYYDQRQVFVEAMLDTPIVFREGYTVTVQATSILGGRQLVLSEGDAQGAVLKDAESLVGAEPSDVMDDATAVIKSLRDFLEGDFLAHLGDAAQDLAEVSQRLAKGEGTLGRLLSSDETLYRDLEETVDGIKTVAQRLERGEGMLGRLLSSDETVYNDLRDTLANVRGVTDRLERGEGTLGKLLSSDEVVYNDLRDTLANIRGVTDRLERGEGTLGRLLSSDEAVYNDLRDTLANIREVTDRLKRGEGTLGKLLSEDSELYDNINGAVSDVRETIDDMREVTPVSTFSSFIFGAF